VDRRLRSRHGTQRDSESEGAGSLLARNPRRNGPPSRQAASVSTGFQGEDAYVLQDPLPPEAADTAHARGRDRADRNADGRYLPLLCFW